MSCRWGKVLKDSSLKIMRGVHGLEVVTINIKVSSMEACDAGIERYLAFYVLFANLSDTCI